LIPGKTGRQCRERFQHYLHPGLAQAPWTPAEDEMIRRLHTQYGPDWARIAQQFDGCRTNNNIKNRWNHHVSRQRDLLERGFPIPDIPMRTVANSPATPEIPWIPPPSPGEREFDAQSDVPWSDAGMYTGTDWFGDLAPPDQWPL
jgi:hypothetical protein